MKNLGSWFQERFPLINVFSGYLLYAVSVTGFRLTQQKAVRLTKFDFVIGLCLVCHFLLLRVIDEHKDFKDDLSLHPSRVLQRGLVSLKTLRWVGVIAFILPTVLMTVFANQVREASIYWLALMVWTALMSVEFFNSAFLRKHLFLYSLSHMLVLPFMILWAIVLGAGHVALNDGRTLIFLLMVLSNGMIYEVTRKAKASDEAVSGEATFRSLWGARRTAFVIAAFAAISFFCFCAYLLTAFNPGFYFYLPTAFGLAMTIGAAREYAKHSAKKTRKGLESAGALYVLIAYATVIIAAYRG